MSASDSVEHAAVRETSAGTGIEVMAIVAPATAGMTMKPAQAILSAAAWLALEGPDIELDVLEVQAGNDRSAFAELAT